MNEIEDAVLSRRLPGNERRPGNGTLRGRCGSEGAETAPIAKMREVRKSIPVPLDEAGVHSIYAKHNDFTGFNSGAGGPA